MEGKRVICLFLFVVFMLFFCSCHPRHVSDIKLGMTKEQVISLWGRTDLITYKTVNGATLETWEYHFGSSGSICRITFIQDRVATNPQCSRPSAGGGYYLRSEQNKSEPHSTGRSLVREGFFAMNLAEAIGIGPVKSEAEAESMLASVGIAPKNGWIADYPVTPDIIEELQKAIGAAADSGKIAMDKAEAMRVFEDLITEIESQYARVEPSPSWERYPEPYYYPQFYYYPYYYPYYFSFPYPYYYGGYYRYYRHHYYPHHYPYHRYRR